MSVKMSIIAFLLFFACFSCIHSKQTSKSAKQKSTSKPKTTTTRRPLTPDQIVYSFMSPSKSAKPPAEPEYGFYGVYDHIGPNPYKYSKSPNYEAKPYGAISSQGSIGSVSQSPTDSSNWDTFKGIPSKYLSKQQPQNSQQSIDGGNSVDSLAKWRGIPHYQTPSSQQQFESNRYHGGGMGGGIGGGKMPSGYQNGDAFPMPHSSAADFPYNPHNPNAMMIRLIPKATVEEVPLPPMSEYNEPEVITNGNYVVRVEKVPVRDRYDAYYNPAHPGENQASSNRKSLKPNEIPKSGNQEAEKEGDDKMKDDKEESMNNSMEDVEEEKPEEKTKTEAEVTDEADEKKEEKTEDADKSTEDDDSTTTSTTTTEAPEPEDKIEDKNDKDSSEEKDKGKKNPMNPYGFPFPPPPFPFFPFPPPYGFPYPPMPFFPPPYMPYPPANHHPKPYQHKPVSYEDNHDDRDHERYPSTTPKPPVYYPKFYGPVTTQVEMNANMEKAISIDTRQPYNNNYGNNYPKDNYKKPEYSRQPKQYSQAENYPPKRPSYQQAEDYSPPHSPPPYSPPPPVSSSYSPPAHSQYQQKSGYYPPPPPNYQPKMRYSPPQRQYDNEIPSYKRTGYGADEEPVNIDTKFSVTPSSYQKPQYETPKEYPMIPPQPYSPPQQYRQPEKPKDSGFYGKIKQSLKSLMPRLKYGSGEAYPPRLDSNYNSYSRNDQTQWSLGENERQPVPLPRVADCDSNRIGKCVVDRQHQGQRFEGQVRQPYGGGYKRAAAAAGAARS